MAGEPLENELWLAHVTAAEELAACRHHTPANQDQPPVLAYQRGSTCTVLLVVETLRRLYLAFNLCCMESLCVPYVC
jgi:hypothetical protein